MDIINKYKTQPDGCYIKCADANSKDLASMCICAVYSYEVGTEIKIRQPKSMFEGQDMGWVGKASEFCSRDLSFQIEQSFLFYKLFLNI